MERIALWWLWIPSQSDLTLLTPIPPFPPLVPLGCMSSMSGSIMAYLEKCCQIEVHNLWRNLLGSCIAFSESSLQLPLLIICKVMDRRSESIKSWNSTSVYSSTSDKTTGTNSFYLRNSNTTITFIPLLCKFRSCWTLVGFRGWGLNPDNAAHIQKTSTSSKTG